jgi:radical SAM superfamily enzyme YgiQ (UPF0313 family)
MRVLLITPPMTQINSPYPATPYLTAHLRALGHEVRQADLGLELALALFSRAGLERVAAQLKAVTDSDAIGFFREALPDYLSTIDPVIRFLQGRDPSLAVRIARRTLLPEGPRFQPLEEHSETLLEQFGEMGLQDLAKYRASLYLDDLADVIRDGVDPRFEFSRYGESLASSQASFTPLYESLKRTTLVDEILLELVDQHLAEFKADVIGFSVPFPGNVYGALRIGAHVRERVKARVMGGGFVNTELREVSDPRLFEFVDYLSFDDGEEPLARLLAFLEKGGKREELPRVKYLEAGRVQSGTGQAARAFRETLAPDFSGLPLDRYISMLELPNPMYRLWSDFRWNKMILAHGCYWKKCTFCDTHLDYIGRFEPHKVDKLVDQMEQVARQTGSTGFHFVDEAAPPALLKALSQEILRRGLKFTWWGNLRFDEFFTAEVAELMADAGCIAVTGGLEVASPRLLRLINKGITLEQVGRVTRNFRNAGIFVHAYLMYGFPSQTRAETVESLENVRRLFADGCLDSAHWHRFLCTVHSPVGRAPEKFGIELTPVPIPQQGLFARYEVPFRDRVSTDHESLGAGLRKAVYNFMHGVGFDAPVKSWF